MAVRVWERVTEPESVRDRRDAWPKKEGDDLAEERGSGLSPAKRGSERDEEDGDDDDDDDDDDEENEHMVDRFAAVYI